MTKNTGRELWEYDLFVSYARFDDELRALVQQLVPQLRITFRELTGLEPRIFVDSDEIASAMLWEERIETALASSAVFLVVETPSYYTSEWCQHELDNFLILEADRRHTFELQSYESLIFPVRCAVVDMPLKLDRDEQDRFKTINARQATNLVGISPNSQPYNERIERLIIDIASVLRKLTQTNFNIVDQERVGTRVKSQPVPTAPLVTTYPGRDESKLVQLLADSQAVTIVGITNEDIADLLERAISEKRRKAHNSTAFWDHLHVVFLAEELLPYVKDSLSSIFPTKALAYKDRVRRVNLSRRRIMSQLLRNGVSDRWTLYTYPYALPITGILFIMPDGRRLIQLWVMHPSRQEDDHLTIEFLDRIDPFFESAFRELVKTSTEEHEIVLVGAPQADFRSFLCRGSRFRRSVLQEGRNTSDWLAAVVAITWRAGAQGAEPLLQVNTPRNSTREIGKASHVSGYINAIDYSSSDSKERLEDPNDFIIPLEAAENAVKRELLDDFGIRATASLLKFVSAEPFYYANKENIFFYVFTQSIEPTHQFASDAQMFAWSMDELFMMRRHQVLANAKRVLTADLTLRQRVKARDLVVENLIAQGDLDMADEVGLAVAQGDLTSQLENRIDEALQNTRIFKYAFGRELESEGFAGLQYRVFYSVLLPAYAALGVEGAHDYLEMLKEEPRRYEAVRSIAMMYGDAEYMISLPIEI